MADEPHVLRGINWREALPFTHLFRAFRIAIHPSKIFLAAVALLALYLGGRALDALWSATGQAMPVAGEIRAYQQQGGGEALLHYRQRERENAARAYARHLPLIADKPGEQYARLRNPDEALAAARDARYTGDVAWRIRRDRDGEVAELIRRRDAALAQAANDDARHQAHKTFADDLRVVYGRAAAALNDVKAVKGQGLFAAFFEYQSEQINQVVSGVLEWRWLGENGVLASILRFFVVAPSWALRTHPVYFLFFGALFLAIWSLFGGAISRIAAVHVAEEGRKLSVRQGISFAVSKFLSFLSAPLIPLIILLGIGIGLSAAAFVVTFIYLDVLVGAFFFLALAAGIVMTLVVLGTAGGLNLMYPTIAVEGSDSFDAISRAFSYVYARPWRMLFYSLVAIAYGALTYLFVRFFIWLTLALTQFFVGLFIYWSAPGGGNYWSAVMPPPDFSSLPYQIAFDRLGAYGGLTAWLVAVWNYLLISLLGAFAISFYFSVNTIIYYLMRREVDATEMDDVYLDQPDDDFGEPRTATPAAQAPATETAAAPSANAQPPGETAQPPAQEPPPGA